MDLPVRTVLPESGEQWFDLDACAQLIDDGEAELQIAFEIQRLKEKLTRMRQLFI